MNPARLREVVTVYNRSDGTADRYGNAADTFDDGTTWPAWVAPQGASESLNDRDTRSSAYLFVFAPDTDVYADSELLWDDLRFRVDGKPQAYSGHNGADHIEVTATLLEG
jgi:hypothetical protein